MPTNQADIQLSPNQKAYLAERANRTGRPWDELLRELVPEVPASSISDASALEVAERLGLIGVCGGDPSDLATNPSHMSGFAS